MFQIYKRTYPNADYDQIWDAFDAVAVLWNRVGIMISDSCGYQYPEKTEKEMLEFILTLKNQL
ncbi:aminoglycoside 6-adenylyltransferase [Butyrivibrio sp. INlla16]|uniref:aminoglycoside 6-adenylyltransferase n=1 Tax=Butyrivibrio sp. INlla16 TaxID=1520807 RepID=UPI000B898CFA